ncbi:MAG TPA: HAD hydrolase-like protein [Gemmataceae bacterium]|jgi:phosphonatase-like hydrolase|nr:HAD hydrolase-like protein [Gemmataceae bacterium]
MAIELVIFDMAGTTVRDGDAVADCFRAALYDAGLVVTREAVNRVMGLHKPEAIHRLVKAAPADVFVAASETEIHADFVARMVRHYRTDEGVREVAGTSGVFERLHRAGIKNALNSGFSREIAKIIIDRLDWIPKGLVDASVTSDEVTRGRPHPEMIQLLMKNLGVTDAANVVKVGDTPADLEEGTNAGCGRVIGVTQGSHTRAELARYPHTDLIETVADLPALLGLD